MGERMAKAGYVRECAVCGKTFSTTLYNKVLCSAECQKRRMKEQQKERCRREREGRTCVCAVCGKTFRLLYRKKFCSAECARKGKAEQEKERHKAETSKFRFPKRKCHDCGAPTFDYRCEECWRKWRQKYGGVEEETPTPRDFDEDEFL